MNPAPGQRWLWTIEGSAGCPKSKTVIEITHVESDGKVHFVYLQVMIKGYPNDVVGRSDSSWTDRMDRTGGSSSFIYLEGQDKT